MKPTDTNKLGKAVFVAIAIALIAAGLGVDKIVKATTRGHGSESIFFKTNAMELYGESFTYAEEIEEAKKVVQMLENSRSNYDSEYSSGSSALDNAKSRLAGWRLINAAGKVFLALGIVTIVSLASSLLVEFLANDEETNKFNRMTYMNLSLITLVIIVVWVLFYVGVVAIWITGTSVSGTVLVVPSTSMGLNIGALCAIVALTMFIRKYSAEDADTIIVSNTTTTQQPQMMYQQPMYTQPQMMYQQQPQMAYQPQPQAQPANMPTQAGAQHVAVPIQS
jgi:hypothetical protein